MASIVLGVSGGIAAYKACELLRRLKDDGHDVTPIPTPATLGFVGETTWAALSGKPIRTRVDEDAHLVPHVTLGRAADLVFVAPATADLMARVAAGRCDDLLTATILTATCPIVMAPAMHTEMWLNAATQANVATLRERGITVIDPAEGRLTGADTGPGRLVEPAELLLHARSVLADPEVARSAARQDLAGVRLVVSAGGTRERLDPVRYLGNHSSGLMGFAIARAARLRGATVTVVAGAVDHEPPAGCTVEEVVSTADLDAAMRRHEPDADAIVMAAAPADFTPASRADGKIKKDDESSGLQLDLVQTPDVLHGLAQRRDASSTSATGTRRTPLLVGFAAETAGSVEALTDLARAKRRRKGCDLIVANDVSGGAIFGAADNSTLLVDEERAIPVAGDKNVVAHRIVDWVSSQQSAD